jgi:lysophospholipase L1-like esterase
MTQNSLEEIAKIKSQLWDDLPGTGTSTLTTLSAVKYLVAEGDSWFDYLPELDILDNLKKEYGYNNLIKISQAGDTLDNMVYGTKFKPNWQPDEKQIVKTLTAVTKYNPKVFLFSGGGNDLAGIELDAFFNHADSQLPSLLRKDYLEYIMFTVFKKSFLDLISKLHTINPDLHIICHGYGYPIPDGRAVINLFDYRFIGPWLRPTFARKNISNDTIGRDLMKQLIDRFNDMLLQLDSEVDKFHYLDLRSIINDEDWVNELHLSSDGYKKVAGLFDSEIKKYL